MFQCRLRSDYTSNGGLVYSSADSTLPFISLCMGRREGEEVLLQQCLEFKLIDQLGYSGDQEPSGKTSFGLNLTDSCTNVAAPSKQVWIYVNELTMPPWINKYREKNDF